MRVCIREAAHRMSALSDRALQDRCHRAALAREHRPPGWLGLGLLVMRASRGQRLCPARVIFLAGAIVTAALLASVDPPPADATAARPAKTTCANELLTDRTYDDVTVAPGHWCAIGFSTVRGTINVTRATTFFLFASKVMGDVTVTGTTSHPNAAIAPGLGPASAICASALYGNLTITDSSSTAPWNISGTNYPPYLSTSNCLSQIFVLGNVTFDNNHGSPNEIGGADIEGNLECHGNGNFTAGVLTPYQKNGVKGTTSGQCAGLAVKGDNPDIFPGPPPWLTVDPGQPTVAPQHVSRSIRTQRAATLDTTSRHGLWKMETLEQTR